MSNAESGGFALGFQACLFSDNGLHFIVLNVLVEMPFRDFALQLPLAIERFS
jgi:hypothetical protein